jgi:hypothetical protein
MDKHDIAIIGAGPCALGALTGLKDNQRICVITGEVPYDGSLRRLHPKIRSVAADRGERPGIADPFPLLCDKRQKLLFSSSKMGGLANYWGQQFISYREQDPWPTTVFDTYEAYLKAVHGTEALFEITASCDIRNKRFSDDAGMRVRSPYLMTGTPNSPGCQLFAVSKAMEHECTKRKICMYNGRATRLARDGGDWLIHMRPGPAVKARRIVLAAGAIGTSQLLFASFPELTRIRIHDHTPWMLYTFGIERLFKKKQKSDLRHFNIATLEGGNEESGQFFASVYDISKAELNLITSLFAGFASSLFKGIPTPPGSGLIKPSQVWTTNTYGFFDITPNNVGVTASCSLSHKEDQILTHFIAGLRALGIRVLRIEPTAPGLGYHYHNLNVALGNCKFEHITPFLSRASEGTIVCADASSLSKIGTRPPTLTGMAAAAQITSLHQE